MIDKVHLRQVYASPPPERELRKFERTRDGSLVFNEPKPKGLKLKLPSLIYRAAKDGKHYLTVSVSLPKMLHGDNVRTLCDEEVKRALEQLTLFACSRSGLEFNAPTVPVSLVEFGALSHVGEENVPHYLTAVEGASVARMVRNIRGNERNTVEFVNGSEEIVLYSKHAETMRRVHKGEATDDALRASVGLLRLERRFLNTGAVKRLAARLRLPDRNAGTILREAIAEKVLSEAMSELGLNQRIESKDSRFDILRDYCGKDATLYRNLVCFVALADVYGEGRLLELGLLSRPTFYKCRKHVRQAGVLIATPLQKALPPLRLVRPLVGQSRNVASSL